MKSAQFSDIFDDACRTHNELHLMMFMTESTDSQLQTQTIFFPLFLAALMS